MPATNAVFPSARLAEVRLTRAWAELDREPEAVGEIQRSVLLASLPEIHGFEMSPYDRSSERASGDYYDVVPLIDRPVEICHGGCEAGHGTPAAVIMTVMRTLMHAEQPQQSRQVGGQIYHKDWATQRTAMM